MWFFGGPKLCTKFEVASFSHCVNIKGDPPDFGELSQPTATPTLFSACDFMMGLRKPQLHAKFEVASPTHCGNIIGKPKLCGASLAQGRRHFPLCVILSWALANPSCVPNLKSLASAIAEILKGKPQISGSSHSPGSHRLFLLVGFDDGPWQTPAGFIYYGNIREFTF